MNKLSMIMPLAFSIWFVAGCQNKAAMVESEGSAGFVFSSPAPSSDEKLSVLVSYDMEGLSGQDDWRTTHVLYPEQYKKGRELLTADVNAVIEGLFEGGADNIYVKDAHGSGNPDPDIILEKMDSRAQLASPRNIPEGRRFGEYYDIDAIAAVGYHSRTGGGGFMPHTRSFGLDFIINGKSINETELMMLDWGTGRGVPLVFASGDDKLEEELRPYYWVEYVTVKFATSASTAELRPVDVVHEEMREAAARAVKNIPNTKAIGLKTPFKAGLRAVPPASLSILRRLPGIDYQNGTVTFEAEDYGDARRNGWVALARIAGTGYDQLRMQTFETLLAKHEDPMTISKEVNDVLFKRWLDHESGRQSSD